VGTKPTKESTTRLEDIVNIDEFEQQVRKDELEDQPLITPVEYGRLRGIAPQLVYYYIRNKKLATQICPCGRRCLNKEETDEHFRRIGKLAPATTDSEDASGSAPEDRTDES
jgi:hypothetical protein